MDTIENFLKQQSLLNPLQEKAQVNDGLASFREGGIQGHQESEKQ